MRRRLCRRRLCRRRLCRRRLCLRRLCRRRRRRPLIMITIIGTLVRLLALKFCLRTFGYPVDFPARLLLRFPERACYSFRTLGFLGGFLATPS
ncbi:hypothetical protein NFJ02_26g61610 [Pycnococcus provasolii]